MIASTLLPLFGCVLLWCLTGCGASPEDNNVAEAPKRQEPKREKDTSTDEPTKTSEPKNSQQQTEKNNDTDAKKTTVGDLKKIEAVKHAHVETGRNKYVTNIAFPSEDRLMWIEHRTEAQDMKVAFMSLDLKTKKVAEVDLKLPKSFFHASLSQNGKRFGYLFYSTSPMPQIVLFDVTTRKQIKKLEAPFTTSDFQISPEGDTIVVRKFLQKDGKVIGTAIAMLDVKTGKAGPWQKVPDFSRLSFSRDGKVVAVHTQQENSSMPIWNGKTNKSTNFELEDSWVNAVLAPDGKHLAVLEGKNPPFEIKLIDLKTRKTKTTYPVLFNYGQIGISLDGQVVALAGYKLVFWNGTTGKKIGGADIPDSKNSGSPYTMVLSNNKGALAIVTPEGLTVWKLKGESEK